MLFGLVTYVVYRKLVEGTSLTERVTVPEMSLKKQAAEIEYSNILVPVFGTELDDEIIATAGRLADAEVEEGGVKPRIEVIFVAELPLTVPIDAPLPEKVREQRGPGAGAGGPGRRRVRERGGGDGVREGAFRRRGDRRRGTAAGAPR